MKKKPKKVWVKKTKKYEMKKQKGIKWKKQSLKIIAMAKKSHRRKAWNVKIFKLIDSYVFRIWSSTFPLIKTEY